MAFHLVHKKNNGFSIGRSARKTCEDFNSENATYNEQHFNEVVCLEQKRSDRSKKPFLIMLVDIRNAIENGNNDKVCQSVIEALSKSTREIDTKGWHKYGAVMGVLFSELGEAACVVSKDVIFNRFHAALCECLDNDIVDDIVISFFLYPEENHKWPPAEPPRECLYPELIKKSSREGGRVENRERPFTIRAWNLIRFVKSSEFFTALPIWQKGISKQ